MKKIYLTKILIVLAIFCHAQNNCLIAYYPFNGNTNDESGNGFNGTNNGAILTTDRFGNANQAYSFDGTSAYINIPNFDTLKSYTISAWIKENVTTSEGRIFSNGCYGCYDGSVDFGCYYNGTSNAPFIVNQNGTTQSSFHGNDVIDTNWNYVVFTYNDSTDIQMVFVNGVLDSGSYDLNSGWLSTPASPNQNPAYNYRIGCNAGGSSFKYFNGKIDDIRVYGCPLAAEAIDTLYHSGGYAGINEMPAAMGISIYPNPAKGKFIISFNDATPPESSIKVFNTLGEMIYFSTIKNQKQDIDLSSAAAGIYFVQVTSDTRTLTQKIMKE